MRVWRYGVLRTVGPRPDRICRPRRRTGAPRPRARHGRGSAVVFSESRIHRLIGDRAVTEKAGGSPSRQTGGSLSCLLASPAPPAPLNHFP